MFNRYVEIRTTRIIFILGDEGFVNVPIRWFRQFLEENFSTMVAEASGS